MCHVQKQPRNILKTNLSGATPKLARRIALAMKELKEEDMAMEGQQYGVGIAE